MSIVRDNLLSREGYTPYCGSEYCTHSMPRTQYRGGQFECLCSWRSGFSAEFIQKYEARWAPATTNASTKGDGK